MKLTIILLLTCACIVALVIIGSLAIAGPAATRIIPKSLVARNTPTLRWKAVPGVSQYLMPFDQGSTPVHRQWVTATQARCTTECKFILPIDLVPDNYTRTDTDYSPWSETIKFSIKIMTLEQETRSCFIQFTECEAVVR